MRDGHVAVARRSRRARCRRRPRPRDVARRRAEPAVAAFCDDVITVARTTGCEIVVTLGALLGDMPHSRPMRCTGRRPTRCSRRGSAWSVRATRARPASSACCTTRSRRVGFASASIWAPVPHYVATPPNPKATHALLDKLRAAARPRPRPHRSRHRGERVGTVGRRGRRRRRRRRARTSNGSKRATTTRPRPGVARRRRRRRTDDDDDEDWLDEDDLPSGESLAEDFERYLRENRATTAPSRQRRQRDRRARPSQRRVESTSDSMSTRSSLPWNIEA